MKRLILCIIVVSFVTTHSFNAVIKDIYSACTNELCQCDPCDCLKCDCAGISCCTKDDCGCDERNDRNKN